MRCCCRRTILRWRQCCAARCSASRTKICLTLRGIAAARSLRAALARKAGETTDLRRCRCAARRTGAGGAARDAVCILRAAARPGGARRRFLARLGPEANDALDEFLNRRARIRAARDAVAAGLPHLAARRARRGEARHGDRARRSAGHDRARRQGPRSADRHPCRYHHAAGGPRPPRLLQLGRRCDDLGGPQGRRRRQVVAAARGARIPKPRTNTAGCSTSP